MAAFNGDESDFGDNMALVPSMMANTSGQVLGSASAPAAAVPLKKVAPQRPDAAAVLLTERMHIVWQYDLTTAAGIDKFAQEMILQRTPARMDTDFGAMNPEDAREGRKADPQHCVDFWSAIPAAHGGVQSRFNQFYGSMAFGFVHLAAADLKWREVPEQVGRASHKRTVLAPVVVSVMFRTKLLGDTNMQQINQLYVVTCVRSSFSWYVAPLITPCTDCAWQCHSDCATTCHTWCSCAGRGRNKYGDVYAQRSVSMGVLVNTHSCGVSVRGVVSHGARRHRTPCMHTLFASTHNMNMCVSSN